MIVLLKTIWYYLDWQYSVINDIFTSQWPGIVPGVCTLRKKICKNKKDCLLKLASTCLYKNHVCARSIIWIEDNWRKKEQKKLLGTKCSLLESSFFLRVKKQNSWCKKVNGFRNEDIASEDNWLGWGEGVLHNGYWSGVLHNGYSSGVLHNKLVSLMWSPIWDALIVFPAPPPAALKKVLIINQELVDGEVVSQTPHSPSPPVDSHSVRL